MIKKVCVFCGSSMGNEPSYREAAALLGEVLAQKDCSLYYGGGNVGLMTIIADKMLEKGKEVVGVIPKSLIDMEVAHFGLTKLIEVDTMAERKDILINDSDAVIAMPGGFGTLDELFEIIVLNQLRFTNKAVALYNTLNYYDSLIQFIDHAVNQGFIREEHRENIIISDDANVLVDSLLNFKPINIKKTDFNDKKE